MHKEEEGEGRGIPEYGEEGRDSGTCLRGREERSMDYFYSSQIEQIKVLISQTKFFPVFLDII